MLYFNSSYRESAIEQNEYEDETYMADVLNCLFVALVREVGEMSVVCFSKVKKFEKYLRAQATKRHDFSFASPEGNCKRIF